MDKEQIRELLNIEEASRTYLFGKNKVVLNRDLDGLFHPSSLGSCSRKIQYHYLGEHPIKKIPSSTYAIFDLGHAVHDMLQSRLLEVLKARFDKTEYTFELVIEKGINDTEFAQEYEIAGSADGLKEISDKAGGLICSIIYEAKSISLKGWNKLSSPLIKHRLQTSVYATALKAEYVLFEYFCKDNAKSKWYFIDTDKAALQSAIHQINKVRSATDRLDILPREGSSYECADCAYLEICLPEGVPL